MTARGWASAIGAEATPSQRALYGAQFATRSRGNRPTSRAPKQGEIAREVRVSERLIRRAVAILRSAAPDVVEAVRSGRMPIDLAADRHPVDERLQASVRRALVIPICSCGAGYTYIVGAAGMVKIGRAINPLRRIPDVQACSPLQLEILALARGIRFEAVLHRRFAGDRRHGEWFVDVNVRKWLDAMPASGRGCCIRCGTGGTP